MALTLGQGILPSGAIGNQLTYITRRAVLPKAVVQIYNSSPTICALLQNSKKEAGGVDSVQANVQSASLVQPQWSGFTGQFTAPTAVSGITPAAWAMCMALCPIPVFINEFNIQDKQAIQSILNLRFGDAGNAIRDMLAQSLFNNSTNNQQILGLPAAIDDGTVLATYAGINRSSNSYWQSKRYAAGSVNPTRALMLQYIAGVVKQQGEKPVFGVCNFGTWTLLAQDFLPLERYLPRTESDKYTSAFDALDVAGVPVFGDPYCPEGTCYFINTNYLTMRIHEQGEWEFLDFESMIPVNQLGYTGVVFMLLCLINTKPKASAIVTGLNSLSI